MKTIYDIRSEYNPKRIVVASSKDCQKMTRHHIPVRHIEGTAYVGQPISDGHTEVCSLYSVFCGVDLGLLVCHIPADVSVEAIHKFQELSHTTSFTSWMAHMDRATRGEDSATLEELELLRSVDPEAAESAMRFHKSAEKTRRDMESFKKMKRKVDSNKEAVIQMEKKKEMLSGSIHVMQDGGYLTNCPVTTVDMHGEKLKSSVVVAMAAAYGVDVPPRTKHWINTRFAGLEIVGGEIKTVDAIDRMGKPLYRVPGRTLSVLKTLLEVVNGDRKDVSEQSGLTDCVSDKITILGFLSSSS